MNYLILLIPILTSFTRFSKKYKAIISTSLITIYSSIRFGIGADYFNYEFLYYNVSKTSLGATFSNLNLVDVEPGFKLLMSIFRYFSITFQYFLVFVTLVMILAIALWIWDNSEDYLLSLLVYVSFFILIWNFSALRQGLVMSLGCYLLYNRRFKFGVIKRLTIVLFLATIHLSALFYIILMVTDVVKWDRKRLLLLVGVSLVLTLLPTSSIFGLLKGVPFLSKLGVYSNAIYQPFGFWDFKSIPRLFFIFLGLFFYNRLLLEKKFDTRVLNHYIIGLSVFFVLRFNNLIGARFSIYGFFFIMILLPSMLKLAIEKFERIKIMNLFLYLVFLLTCVSYYTKDLAALYSEAYMVSGSPYISYVTIFDKEKFIFDHPYYYSQNYKKIDQLSKSESVYKEFFRFNRQYAKDKNDIENFIPVQFPNGKYGLINSAGEIVVAGEYNSLQYTSGIMYYNNTSYMDINGVKISQSEGLTEFSKNVILVENEIQKLYQWEGVGFLQFSKQIVNSIEKETNLKLLRINISIIPSNIYIGVFMHYNDGNLYKLYNDKFELIENYLFTNYRVVNKSGVIRAESEESVQYFNQKGERIWVELKLKNLKEKFKEATQ